MEESSQDWVEAAPPTVRGRGAALNPKNRFEALEYRFDPDPSLEPEDLPKVQTVFLRDTTKTIIARNDSPDVGFDASVNPYRGCEHGCAYCFARPTHEYLGFSAGLDFETRIMVKERAPELLEHELNDPKWTPQPLIMSGVTDCYQPVERKLELTRGCLRVLAKFRNPVAIITKNRLVARDVDYLGELAGFNCARVNVSVTTLDDKLAGELEPRASRPGARLEAIRILSGAGVPVNVMIGPVIPGLNDEEIPKILEAAKEAGASSAGYVLLRLPYAVAPLFEDWLERHRPEKKQRILARVRATRGGKMYESAWFKRMRGGGPVAEQIEDLFKICVKRVGLGKGHTPMSVEHFRREREQMDLF